ncbi:MAG: FeoA family protein [Oscillospiraceae bacterium]|nr:FeoA family protein [Oscillospiraceae bacterium]
MMPITFASPGDVVSVKKISGNDEMRLHLAKLGFVVGEKVRIISKVAGDSLIIQVMDSRIALDKSMANRIMI